jgi:hypothetical protein
VVARAREALAARALERRVVLERVEEAVEVAVAERLQRAAHDADAAALLGRKRLLDADPSLDLGGRLAELLLHARSHGPHSPRESVTG